MAQDLLYVFFHRLERSGQVKSECLTCMFRKSCCSARLSRTQILAFASFSVHDKKLERTNHNLYNTPAQWLRKASPMVEGGQPNSWGRPAQWLNEASPMVEWGQPNGWGRPAQWLREASQMVEGGQPNGWGRPA